MIEALARHHFPVLICNGWFVTPEVARAIFAAGLYEVSVSVDFADAARHDAQRGTAGAFERALEALAILREARVEPYQRVHLILVLMEDNLNDVESLIERCRRLGITFLITIYSDARGTKDCRALSADAGERLLALKRRHPEFVALRGYLGSFSRAVRENGVGPCRAGKNLCNIDSQGEVALCIDRRQETVGNILTDDIHLLEARLAERQRSNDCRSCWTSCRGSIETLMYGPDRLGNLWDYYQMTKPIALGTPGRS